MTDSNLKPVPKEFDRLIDFVSADIADMSGDEVLAEFDDNLSLHKASNKALEDFDLLVASADTKAARLVPRPPQMPDVRQIRANFPYTKADVPKPNAVPEQANNKALSDEGSNGGDVVTTSTSALVINALVLLIASSPGMVMAARLLHEATFAAYGWLNVLIWYGLAAGGGIVVYNNVVFLLWRWHRRGSVVCGISIGSLSGAAILGHAISVLPQ